MSNGRLEPHFWHHVKLRYSNIYCNTTVHVCTDNDYCPGAMVWATNYDTNDSLVSLRDNTSCRHTFSTIDAPPVGTVDYKRRGMAGPSSDGSGISTTRLLPGWIAQLLPQLTVRLPLQSTAQLPLYSITQQSTNLTSAIVSNILFDTTLDLISRLSQRTSIGIVHLKIAIASSYETLVPRRELYFRSDRQILTAHLDFFFSNHHFYTSLTIVASYQLSPSVHFESLFHQAYLLGRSIFKVLRQTRKEQIAFF